MGDNWVGAASVGQKRETYLLVQSVRASRCTTNRARGRRPAPPAAAALACRPILTVRNAMRCDLWTRDASPLSLHSTPCGSPFSSGRRCPRGARYKSTRSAGRRTLPRSARTARGRSSLSSRRLGMWRALANGEGAGPQKITRTGAASDGVRRAYTNARVISLHSPRHQESGSRSQSNRDLYSCS